MAMRTISTCTTETTKGIHRFEIFCYSLMNIEAATVTIQSGVFSIGGFDWVLLYYPDGIDDDNKGYISVYLELISKDGEPWALVDVNLIKQQSGQHRQLFTKSDVPTTFRSTSFHESTLVKRSEIESTPGFVIHDCIGIECIVTIIYEPKVSKTRVLCETETRALCEIEVPPMEISSDFAKMLEDGVRADVTFKVGEDTFRAHRVVLAARSSVFHAQLCGPMKEKETRMKEITIQDMQPTVFEAFLYFIYTDSVPRMDDLGDGEKKHLMMHLLMAGDRYGLGRLKIMCESFLAMNLDAENVSAILGLFDLLDLKKLKEACMEFMIPSERMDAVAASQGYQQLKRASPSLAFEVWERRSCIGRN